MAEVMAPNDYYSSIIFGCELDRSNYSAIPKDLKSRLEEESLYHTPRHPSDSKMQKGGIEVMHLLLNPFPIIGIEICSTRSDDWHSRLSLETLESRIKEAKEKMKVVDKTFFGRGLSLKTINPMIHVLSNWDENG